MDRIDFFIAGVQKSGTTALDTFLREHPNLQMACIKEVHFFDNEGVDWNAPDYSLLHDKFDWAATNVLRGEATPIYTYWPNSLERLKCYNPDARLIIGLRHPAMRAYSHWRMETSRNAETMDFSAAIRIGRERVRESPNGAHRVFSYVERGFYDWQVERLLKLFSRDRLHFFRTDRLFSEGGSTLGAIEDFLGVPRTLQQQRRYIAPIESRDPGEMSLEDRNYLTSLFRASIVRTQEAAGVTLSDWLDQEYCEPMTPL